MGRQEIVKYALLAAAALAVAFVVYFYFLRSSEQTAPVSNTTRDSASLESPGASDDQRPEGRETIIAEIDGVIRQVSLPSGKLEPMTDFVEALPMELQLESYTGVDPAFQKPEAPDLWFQPRVGKLIFGHVVTPDGRDVAPVYVCDTEAHRCEHTGPGADLGAATVPQGAVSGTGERLVVINQHDTPNTETGAHWDLLVYATNRLDTPERTIDISAAIDRSPEAAYDSVSSVAWSPDGTQVAIVSSRRIVIVDIRSGTVTQVFEAPAPVDEDANPSWDNSLLVWSPGGRYLAFASYSEAAGASDESDEETADTLTAIDLEQGNALQTLVRGESVRLVTGE
ncbi:MAG: PD40 domain-containing protein [Candidatus Moraniibacteriota bacterium]|nr:MAG: PD40 domain-containing protein [Candidatus Moranbacteria bacterium]